MTTTERTTVFHEAFRDITGLEPTPLAVAEALRNPAMRHQIDEQVEAIRALREDEKSVANL